MHPCTGAGGTTNNAMMTDPETLAVVDAAINQLQQDAGAGTGASGHLVCHKHHIDFVGNTFLEILAGVAVGNDKRNCQHACPDATEDFGNLSNFDETWVNKQGKMIAEEMKMSQKKTISLVMSQEVMMELMETIKMLVLRIANLKETSIKMT